MKKIRVTLRKSVIDRTKRQKATIEALGLKKIDSSREHIATDQIIGMLNKVAHLVQIEEI